MMETIPRLMVELMDRSYPIHFGQEALQELTAAMSALRSANRKIGVVVDAGLIGANVDIIERLGLSGLSIHEVPSGEGSKSVAELARLWSAFAADSFGRDCAIIAVGGGVIGDLAGFTAASYLRGVDFYQIPTTLLAMVDSSVGGKTGINLPEGKNLVGAFWQPKGVFIDPAVLASLPAAEFSAGMAEVIKYGMLCDSALFERLESLPRLTYASPEIPGVIARCCALKAAVVRADERENAPDGGRALLNLGHTFGHAIEKVAGYGDYLHGEAVAVGLVLATKLAIQLHNLNEDALPRVVQLLGRYDLPTELRSPLPIESLMNAMSKDKKNLGGRLRLISMRSLGDAFVASGVEAETIRKLWSEAGAN